MLRRILTLLCPRLGGIKRWCCLTTVWCLSRTSGWRAACGAGRLDDAYWLIGPGSAGLAQGCRCAFLLQACVGAYRGGRPPTACYISHRQRAAPANVLHSELKQFCFDLNIQPARVLDLWPFYPKMGSSETGPRVFISTKLRVSSLISEHIDQHGMMGRRDRLNTCCKDHNLPEER